MLARVDRPEDKFNVDKEDGVSRRHTRKFMRQVFELPADLLPDYAKRKLVVRLHSMANPRSNRALRALCEVLNDFNVCYPKTNLQLVLEAPEPR